MNAATNLKMNRSAFLQHGTLANGLIKSSNVTAASELMADDTVLKDPENIPETKRPKENIKYYTIYLKMFLIAAYFTYINKTLYVSSTIKLTLPDTPGYWLMVSITKRGSNCPPVCILPADIGSHPS